MCLSCSTPEGFCFCGTSMDPAGTTQPCEVKSNPDGTCSRCGHVAAAVPAEASSLGADFVEY
jgi:hypothetical protein